jgi:hypothetical protein
LASDTQEHGCISQGAARSHEPTQSLSPLEGAFGRLGE